jgi:4-amino-4-deoxychorismate lyase
LQYGDGLFETIAVADGHPCLWQRHMQRLQIGCERLGMQAPDVDMLRHEAQSLIGLQEKGVLKLILTRGESRRGYVVPSGIHPNRILYLSDWPHALQARLDAGVRLRFCATRLGMNPSTAGMKHLNRLEQVLARNEWQDDSIFEGLMQDVQNRVVEGTMSNLFMEQSGRLLTPDLSQSGVAGVVRRLVMDVAEQMGAPVSESRLTRADVLQADACYITNSLLGVRQVARLEQRRFNESSTINPIMKAAAVRVFDA